MTYLPVDVPTSPDEWSIVVAGLVPIPESYDIFYQFQVNQPGSTTTSLSMETSVLSYEESYGTMLNRAWVVPDEILSRFVCDDYMEYKLFFRQKIRLCSLTNRLMTRSMTRSALS